MKNIRRIFIQTLALSAALFSVPLAAQQETAASPVRIAEAAIKPIAPRIWVAGTVISLDDARIAAEVEGRITAMADVGDVVRQGDTLATIDDTRLVLQREEARSNVEALSKKISFLKKEVDRAVRLARSQLTSETSLDQARSEYDVAVADRAAAQARLALIEDEIARTRISAPFNGIVTERIKSPGENVSPGTAVIHLIGPDRLEIEASGPLRYVYFVHKGMTIEARNRDNRTDARVRTLVAIGANESRQFVMRLSFKHDGWFPGMPVQVALPTDTMRRQLVVPRDALVLRKDGSYVFRIKQDDTAERVLVKPGVADGELIAISGDIHAGDRVVIRGGERLRPGQKVRILDSKTVSVQ